MATPLLLMSTTTTEPNPKPDSNSNTNLNTNPNPPKTRGRKAGKNSQAGPGGPKKTPQRGMGVAQLERILSQQEQQHHQPQPGPFHQARPLSGVPVQAQPGLAHYGYPTQRAQVPRPVFRVVGGSVGPTEELPSMPNLIDQDYGYQLDHSFKKKRVIGDDLGFMRGRDKSYADYHQILPSINNAYNYYGVDLNLGGAFSGYAAGNEVVAIHRKGNESRNITMEFFPGKSEAIYDEEGHRNFINNNDNSRSSSSITMEDLSLKVGCSDFSSSSPSPSPSSSLSSLSSATTTIANGGGPSSTYLDLSLKLSY